MLRMRQEEIQRQFEACLHTVRRPGPRPAQLHPLGCALLGHHWNTSLNTFSWRLSCTRASSNIVMGSRESERPPDPSPPAWSSRAPVPASLPMPFPHGVSMRTCQSWLPTPSCAADRSRRAPLCAREPVYMWFCPARNLGD